MQQDVANLHAKADGGSTKHEMGKTKTRQAKSDSIVIVVVIVIVTGVDGDQAKG